MKVLVISCLLQTFFFATNGFSQDEETKNPLIFADFFSPNGDGHNDTFIIQNIELYPNNELKVFNRWGELVYSTTNYLNDWNGNSKGGIVDTKLSEGTYFYQFFDGEASTFTGKITLKR